MVIQLEVVVRPRVQFALCRDSAQLPLWDTKMNYVRSTLPDRILAYGVVISEEGPYICAEISPFEPHPLVSQMLASWDLVRSRRRRRLILDAWPHTVEADRIERSVCLLRKRLSQKKLRESLSEIWTVDLPVVTMVSIDGERTWKQIDRTGENWVANLRKRLSGQKRIDPRESCLMLSDRILDTQETDRKRWLRQRLSDRASDCSIYTPGHQAYFPE